MTMTLISTVTVSTPAASISLSSIPATYTDILLVLSGRCTLSAANYSFLMNFNGDGGSNYIKRRLYGSGSSVSSDSGSDTTIGYTINGGLETSNTFSNYQIYIPNYAGSTYKSVSVDGVTENNATGAYQFIGANLWNSTSAINAITITLNGSSNTWATGSTASLYGILKGSGGATVS